MRTALDVPDAVAAQLLFETRRSPPRGVLAPLVGQDLARRTVVRDAARERLQHQRASLVVRHHQAHQVARVIVQERRHVHPLMAPQQEREEVRLPQLIGLRPFEALRLRPGFRFRHLAFLKQPLPPQHPAHRRLRCPDAEEALHHVADAAASGLRFGPLRGKHRLMARISFRRTFAVTHRPARFGAREAPARGLWITACSLAAAARSRLECSAPTCPVLLHPVRESRVRNPQLVSDSLCSDMLVHHRRCSRHHHVQGPRCA
jgi:hypothetical protein